MDADRNLLFGVLALQADLARRRTEGTPSGGGLGLRSAPTISCSDIVTGVYKPDGALTWISINSRPLLDADGVTLGGVVASFQDITERKRTEAALPEASAELARVGRAQQG
jgi:PAS domain-containing protein